jgi:hypothetical protein
MTARGLSGQFQILDDLKLDDRLYRALQHHAAVMANGVDVQGLIQLAVCGLLEQDHPRWCDCLGKPSHDAKPRGRSKRGRNHSVA